MLYLLAALSLLLTTPAHPDPSPKAKLTVDVQAIRVSTGAVYVALFRPGKDFPQGKPAEGKKIAVSGKSAQAVFLVEPGEYAIAVYHDENGNGKMDKRMFGIPKEPYGFSNNFKPVMAAPLFSDCKFTVTDGGKVISIKLR